MNKPASYFVRLRHRKASTKSRKRGDERTDGAAAQLSTHGQLNRTPVFAREADTSNEF